MNIASRDLLISIYGR